MTHPSTNLPSLADLTSINADNHPGGIAFADPDREVTWTDFDDQCSRAANAMHQHVRQGDRVAFLCRSSIEHATLTVGAQRAGAIVTNVHTLASPETIKYCIESARPEVLVYDASFSELVGEHVRGQVDTGIGGYVVIGEPAGEHAQSFDDFVSGQDPIAPDVRVDEDDIALIAWTSGTTGDPKGWCHTHRTVALKGQDLIRQNGLSRTDSYINAFQPSFMAWFNLVSPMMLTGGTVVLLPGWDPGQWASLVEQHEVTHAGLVPTMWRAVLGLELEAFDLSSLEQITFTGEKIDRTTLKRLREDICDSVNNGYASTEINIAEMSNEEMIDDRIESVGKPAGGKRVRIIEEGGTPEDALPAGEVGEIIVKAPDHPVWAWGDTATTRQEFVDGWWQSGDMGFKDEDGFLYVEGRADFMIKSKGVKVFPSPIEEQLNNHPGVEESVVVGVSDEEYGEKVTAVVKRDDPDVTAEELDEWCLESEELARFERPRAYEFIDTGVPRTATGKLDRKTLKANVIGE